VRAAVVALLATLMGLSAATAQVTPARGHTPPDDTPSVKVGGVLFLDYTWQEEPETRDANGDLVHSNGFNVGRAYINVTGQLHHLVSFRVTPDVSREADSGSTLSGSYVFRLKNAYAQLNLDDWFPKSTWVRLGLQPTPYTEMIESVYQYRFQGNVFVEREGFLSTADAGLAAHLPFPADFGDLVFGVYNGEGYQKSETNDQKAFQIRATVRPAPRVPIVKGLRLTGFWDADHYVRDAKRERAIGALTFEHPFVNAGFEYIDAKDQVSLADRELHARGWSVFIEPRTPMGLAGLFRHDELEPDSDANDSEKTRTIAGVAWWFSFKPGITAAILADREQVSYDDFAPAKPTEKRWALHLLLTY
jgi:phosphate-selective porin O/P